MSGEGLFPLPAVTVGRTAAISTDNVYRYWLNREWGEGEGRIGDGATFVMLNPSTADAENDDPTIRRCIGFAKSWGCVRLRVVNLYAYRATKPEAMFNARHEVGIDIVGPDNDMWVTHALRVTAGPVVAAWGANAQPDRVAEVMALPGAARMQVLGLTKAGAPRHPLYMPAASTLTPYRKARS